MTRAKKEMIFGFGFWLLFIVFSGTAYSGPV